MATASNQKSTQKSGSTKSAAGKSGSTAGKKTASGAAAKSGSRSTAAKSGSKAAGKGSAKSAPVKDPIHNRDLKVLVCIVLAAFSIIGFFTKEGLFIWFFRRFVQGLVGKGFFFLPVALLFCAAMLLFVRDRPLGGRIACTLLMTVTVGAMLHLFGCTTEFEVKLRSLGDLYDAGVLPGTAGSGGAIGGLLAILLESLLTRVGAAIVLIVCTLFLLFTAVDMTVAALIERSRESAKLKAEEWKLMREEEQRKAEERRKAAEAAVREKREQAPVPAGDPFAEFELPRHPVTASAPERPAAPASSSSRGRRRAQIDIDPLEELNRQDPVSEPVRREPEPAAPLRREPERSAAPRREVESMPPRRETETRRTYEKPAKPAETAAPRQPVTIPTKPAKPVSDKDWLADILTKDRLRNPAAGSAASKVVHTAITPKPGAAAPNAPTVHTETVQTSQLPQEPLPDADELFKAPAREEVPKAEPERQPKSEPAWQPKEDPVPAWKPKTEPEREWKPIIEAKPAQEPKAESAWKPKEENAWKPVAEPEPEPEKPAITPQLNPTAVRTAQQPRPLVTAEAAAEAAAVLAEEKAARAVEKAETVKARAEMLADIEENLAGEAENQPRPYTFPPLTLLTAGPAEDGSEGMEEQAANARRLSDTIKSFGVPAEICNVVRGPTVTRYEVELEQGVKLTRLTNLADDIALQLGATGVRIAPVPEKISTVGIEVPNRKSATVYLRDILDTPAFRDKAGALPFAVGKDIGGSVIVGDISKLPHLLIAGTTGSGKSVCMNSLILSLLYKCSPEDVRLIMVDPKMMEFGVYNGIPHLLIPVVTDPKKAAGALQWAVMEMMKRNRMIADSGTRDISSYNKLMEKEGGPHLPRMVILIDELADLMMTAAKDVEDSICRIAAVGRACGIHLVVATQRPSAQVITGLMKANISSRIAFAVDSALNSRIILDTSGAEKLVGKGDMLYSPIGAMKPTRVQGAFVTDEEREDVINFVKQQGQAIYDSGLQDEIERSVEKDAKKGEPEEPADSDDNNGGDLDELFNEAVEVVLDSKQASVSMLQRRLKLGYSRAARIVDQMEEQGVVGPYEGSKPRQVLLTREQWDAMRGIEGAPPAFTDYDDVSDEDDGVPDELL